jgi:hypothetical protein
VLHTFNYIAAKNKAAEAKLAVINLREEEAEAYGNMKHSEMNLRARMKRSLL